MTELPTDPSGPTTPSDLSDLPDLQPTARRVARLLDRITDDQLPAPTPCEKYSVRDLLSHLIVLSIAFRDAATKSLGPTTSTSPEGPAPGLPADWRLRLPRLLGEVATAWHSPSAWEGMTEAGGVTLPGEVAGRVALNELMLHGWDLARATGQEYEGEQTAVRELIAFLTPPADGTAPQPGDTEGAMPDSEDRGALFGPPVEVPADAPPLDRLLGLAGRDPHWQTTEGRR